MPKKLRKRELELELMHHLNSNDRAARDAWFDSLRRSERVYVDRLTRVLMAERSDKHGRQA